MMEVGVYSAIFMATYIINLIFNPDYVAKLSSVITLTLIMLADRIFPETMTVIVSMTIGWPLMVIKLILTTGAILNVWTLVSSIIKEKMKKRMIFMVGVTLEEENKTPEKITEMLERLI